MARSIQTNFALLQQASDIVQLRRCRRFTPCQQACRYMLLRRCRLLPQASRRGAPQAQVAACQLVSCASSC